MAVQVDGRAMQVGALLMIIVQLLHILIDPFQVKVHHPPLPLHFLLRNHDAATQTTEVVLIGKVVVITLQDSLLQQVPFLLMVCDGCGSLA